MKSGVMAMDLQFCTADETTLKTMVRANPGYILLKNGSDYWKMVMG